MGINMEIEPDLLPTIVAKYAQQATEATNSVKTVVGNTGNKELDELDAEELLAVERGFAAKAKVLMDAIAKLREHVVANPHPEREEY